MAVLFNALLLGPKPDPYKPLAHQLGGRVGEKTVPWTR